MNLHLNLANLETSTAEDINNPLPFIPLGALSQGLILYDFDFEKKGEDNNSESSWDNNEVQLPAFTKSQEAFSQPNFDYRAPEKLLENHSVIKNSILIDFEKRILRKSSIIAADKKRVSFRESPRDSSSHRRSRSESKNMVFFKLELITNEEPVARCVEAIDDEKRNSVTKVPNRSRVFTFNIEPEVYQTKILCQQPNKPSECTLDGFNHVIKENMKKKTNFEDPIFKPDFSSLFNTRKLSIIKTQKFKWKRLQDIYKSSKLCLFDTIDPNNFMQKDLSNFYFGAALSALAERPHRVRKLFEKQEINPYGAYFVRICQDGVWRYIIIDDFLPVNESDEKFPAFMSPRFLDKEIEAYAMLLEKAYAKVFAGYQNIEWGTVPETIHDFTGAPYINLDLSEDNNIFDTIKDALGKNFIITATCSKDKSQQGKFEAIGLIPQYSYTILSFKEFEYQGRKEQLLEIRNSWGWFVNEWKGRWSRDWYGWTKELKTMLDVNPKDEGAFLMDFGDFLDLFAYVSINKVHDQYHYTSDTFRHKANAFSIRKIEIKQPFSHCYIGLTQYDKRYFRHRLESEKGGYNYTFGRIIIGKKIDFNVVEKELEEGGNFTMKVNNSYIKKMTCGFNYEYLDGVCGRSRDLNMELNLEQGEYYIVVMMDWEDQVFDVTLSCYSQESVTFSRVDYRKNAEIIEEIIGGHAFENIFPLETNTNNVGYKAYKFFAKKEALIIEGFENTSEKNLKVVKAYHDLHPIFKLARNYNEGKTKTISNGNGNHGKIEESEAMCTLNLTTERPSFVCIKFTNMDKYNIIGLDKNVLKNYGFK